MNISVFGLGYVGSVSAAVLASKGHKVIGVDKDESKVALINAGKATIIEPQLAELIKAAIADKQLSATTDARAAMMQSDISFVCVGTPCNADDSVNLQYVKEVSAEIGAALKDKTTFHLVAYRSTILPGTMRQIVIPILETYAAKRCAQDFSVCFNPEFMMEGTAVYDYSHPPKNVVGCDDDYAYTILAKLNRDCTGLDTIKLDFESAELIKYCNNIWHALKVGFANEIGKVCKALNIDSHMIMDVFCQDRKLNLSSYYLKPAFAFGGSCLPKDLRAFLHAAKQLQLSLPIIDAVLPSNELHINTGLEMIMAKGHRQVGILGFSFKANTDDIRESPIVTLIERLLARGYELTLFDANVANAKRSGANQVYLNRIPHILNCMVDSIEEVLARAQTIVIGNNHDDFSDILLKVTEEQCVIDLVRIQKNVPDSQQYHGICW